MCAIFFCGEFWMSRLLLQRRETIRSLAHAQDVVKRGGMVICFWTGNNHWTRMYCSSPQILLIRISTFWGPKKRCHWWENIWRWWQCYSRSGEMDASTKFKVVQEGDRSSHFSLVQGCWGGWRYAEKWSVQYIHPVILRVCSNNYTISYSY